MKKSLEVKEKRSNHVPGGPSHEHVASNVLIGQDYWRYIHHVTHRAWICLYKDILTTPADVGKALRLFTSYQLFVLRPCFFPLYRVPPDKVNLRHHPAHEVTSFLVSADLIIITTAALAACHFLLLAETWWRHKNIHFFAALSTAVINKSSERGRAFARLQLKLQGMIK